MWMMLCFLHGRRGPLPTPSPKVSPSSPTNPLSLCPAGEKTEESSSELASCKPLGTQSSGIESEKPKNKLSRSNTPRQYAAVPSERLKRARASRGSRESRQKKQFRFQLGLKILFRARRLV